MRFFRRSLVALGVAAMLPTIAFIAVAMFYILRAERDRVASEALARAHAVINLIDARLQRDAAALSVLANSTYLDIEDWPELLRRVQRVRKSNPEWEAVVLIDVTRGREVFDTRATQPNTLAAERLNTWQEIAQRDAPSVGNIEGDPPLAWVYVPARGSGEVRYVLAAGIDPHVFQGILVAHGQRNGTSAIVDRRAHFVARTLHYEARLGKPATHFVRDAMRDATSGVYRGRTYEGLKNYTAFETSLWSGWSAHLALPSTLIDTPTSWSFVVAGLAGLGSLALGAALVTLVLRDMAERRRAEETLRQSQKMEAIGQLTGGIAHDFNNLLTAVIGNLDMIRNRTSGNERLQRMADNALEAARRGAKLASQLLAFSRSQRMTIGTVDLQAALRGMSDLMTQSLGPTISLVVHIDEDARFVVSDAHQLELALLNLAVNARDAMPHGGSVSITAQRAQVVDKHLPRGDYVTVSVRDTGAGMSEEVRQRAIEPFFTTKPVGQGTGLGLSQVYGVMRESGGSMSIDSELGAGTTVRLTLRRASRPNDLAISAEPPPTVPAARAAAARVLIVDDDRLVRRFMCESLRSLGYEVTDVEAGPAALARLRAGLHVDLLLVDFAMPGMNGAEVARAARDILPGIRVLVVSGYADSAALEAALGSTQQLRKPFDLTELGAAVAAALRQ